MVSSEERPLLLTHTIFSAPSVFPFLNECIYFIFRDTYFKVFRVRRVDQTNLPYFDGCFSHIKC